MLQATCRTISVSQHLSAGYASLPPCVASVGRPQPALFLDTPKPTLKLTRKEKRRKASAKSLVPLSTLLAELRTHFADDPHQTSAGVGPGSHSSSKESDPSLSKLRLQLQGQAHASFAHLADAHSSPPLSSSSHSEGWAQEAWKPEEWSDDLTPRRPRVGALGFENALTGVIKIRERKKKKKELLHKQSRILDAIKVVGMLAREQKSATNVLETSMDPTHNSMPQGEPDLEELKPHPPHLFVAREEVRGVLTSIAKAVLQDLEPTNERMPIATLAHGLDRVLFNPGVHWLQDPRSRVYNFTPWLQTIPKVNEFAFDRLTGFVKSSRDKELRALAKQQNRQFVGSTSSLSGMLSHCYFLISESKEVDTSVLSRHFRHEPRFFTTGQRMPSSVFLDYTDGVYAIDSGSGDGGENVDKNVLTWLGTILEKFLTTTPETFKTYTRSVPVDQMLTNVKPEAYRYSQSDDFVMRSQLDCYDKRLPGTGVFDIKTRACVPIRLDVLNYEEHAGYVIKNQYGILESFEREYYDLIRSAFLKYSFQVRIGNMDGVLVAYHNADQMFGFQYISLGEMDERLFGPGDGIGDRVFEKCVGLLGKVVREISRCFVNQSIRATCEAKLNDNGMNIWVQPHHWDGPEALRPIQQIRVSMQNYLDGAPARGHNAVSSSADVTWTIHYQIRHLEAAADEMRKSLQGAKDRQFRAYSIPSGVDSDTLEEYWQNLNYSGSPLKTTGSFQPSLFNPASKSIRELRDLSKAGKHELGRMSLLTKDQPPVILGQAIQDKLPTEVSTTPFTVTISQNIVNLAGKLNPWPLFTRGTTDSSGRPTGQKTQNQP